MLSGGAGFDCGRFQHDHRLRPCELRRRKGEVLDAAARPPIRKLGDGALRFSTSPAFPGHAAIVEIVPRSRGGAEIRSFSFHGHHHFGWRRTGSARFVLPAEQHRRLMSKVDSALAPHGLLAAKVESDSTEGTEERVTIVCTDGPGYLIERRRGQAAEILAGSCPLDVDNPHPNTLIACRLDELFRRHLKKGRRPDLATAERCEG